MGPTVPACPTTVPPIRLEFEAIYNMTGTVGQYIYIGTLHVCPSGHPDSQMYSYTSTCWKSVPSVPERRKSIYTEGLAWDTRRDTSGKLGHVANVANFRARLAVICGEFSRR